MLRQIFSAGILLLSGMLSSGVLLSGALASTAHAAAATQTITLGGGCFWCLEAVFDELKGVSSVESGYAGGRVANPSYEQVSSGGFNDGLNLKFDADKMRVFEMKAWGDVPK